MPLRNLFAAGGVVMWPLLGFSVLAIALIIERIVFWVRINKRQQRVVKEVLNLYRRENVVGALDKLKQNADLPIARIFLAALQLEQATPEEFRLALDEILLESVVLVATPPRISALLASRHFA